MDEEILSASTLSNAEPITLQLEDVQRAIDDLHYMEISNRYRVSRVALYAVKVLPPERAVITLASSA